MFIILTRGQITAKDNQVANTISLLFSVIQSLLNSNVLRKAKL